MLRSIFHPRSITIALLALLPVAFVIAVQTVFGQFFTQNLVFMPYVRPAFAVGIAGLAVGSVALVLATIRLIRNWRSWWTAVSRLESWWLLHLWAYGFVAAVLVAGMVHTDLFQNVVLTGTVYIGLYLVAHGVLALVLVYAPQALSRPPRLLRPVDRVLSIVVGLILVVEFGMTVHSQFFFTMAYWNESLASRQFIEQQQILDNVYLGHKFNKDHFYDDEFVADTNGDFIVNSITGSFGLGMVPLPYNFTSVAERELRTALKNDPKVGRVEVQNMGLPSAELHDLIRIYKNVSKPLHPDLTIYAAFLTNDIHVVEADALRHSFYQNWRLYKFIDKLATPYQRATPRIKLKHPLRVNALSDVRMDGGDAPKVPDYVLDPSKEKPSLPEEAFLRRELQRLVFCQPERNNIQGIYDLYLDALKEFWKEARPNFIVVFIPDELQVNDELWSKLMSMVDDPSQFVRDYPQKRVGEFCRLNGIPYLDLLPALQKAQKKQHVYHLRDTHWNAWGNEVAGKAIAKKILDFEGWKEAPSSDTRNGAGAPAAQ